MKGALPVLLLVALAAWAVREVNHLRTASSTEASWFSSDPDGQYHMRRLDRALVEGLPIAPRDPYIAFPNELQRGGAAIPWPPYYTLLLYALARPLAPGVSSATGATGADAQADELQRRSFVERLVATVPAYLAVLTSVLVALAALRLAGPPAGPAGARGPAGLPAPRLAAAAVAGLCHALAFGALKYGYVGNGDHHAFVALLFVTMLWLASEMFDDGRRRPPGASVLLASLCGILAGLLLGAWVAGFGLIALFELALLGAWCSSSDAATRDLRTFAVVFHLIALLVTLPAVVASPWAYSTPSSLVNLTWTHLAALVLGLCFYGLGPLARAARARPWGALAAALSFVGLAALLRLREPLRVAFAWASGSEPFMSFINESQPLWHAGGGWGLTFKYLGYAWPLALVAWLFAARAVRHDRRLLPWIVALPALFLLAFVQRRFADLAVLAEAVLLGWGTAQCLARMGGRRPAERFALAALAVGAVALAHFGVLRTTWLRLGVDERPETPALALERGERALYRWLAQHTPQPADPPRWCVLAQWDLGHGIVWAGERPVVANNFGSYVGADSYLDPWRFFLATDERAGGEVLERRQARYVVVLSNFRRNLAAMVDALHPDAADAWLHGAEPRWARSLGARLLLQMGGPAPDSTTDSGLETLRLVHVSPDEHGDPARPGALGASPRAAVFERVPGARVEGRGEPGEVLRVSQQLAYPGVALPRTWRRAARVDGDGQFALRVPYSTDEPNGDGRALGPLRWSLGARRGELHVPHAAVIEGSVLQLPAD